MIINAIGPNPVQRNLYTGGGDKNLGNKPASLNNVNFTGLTKVFKNKIFIDGQKDIEEILKLHPNTNPVVGLLPKFIFEKLPAGNRREAILEILNAFDDATFAIRDFEPTAYSSLDEIQNRRPKKVNEILTNVLQKHNIIRPWDDINVEYIDAGGKGKVFKLSGLRDTKEDDEFVIKVYHQIKARDWHPYKSHGCYAEINNGIYWRNHEGLDTHRGKFFFGSMRSGYIVSKFLDEDVRLPQRIVPEYKYGIKCTDEEKSGPLVGYNRIKGYNYDYGGMRVVNRIKNTDKVARKELEKIKNMPPEKRIDYWFTRFRLNNSSNRDSVNAGLALGIKYMENKPFYIEKCLKLNSPKVNQALAYVLKYLPHKDAVKYFERLVQTEDRVTQIILFNEIPLLAKRKGPSMEMKDDITATLQEIIPERIHKFYKISEQYAHPETIEHLASFVHLLPRTIIPKQHALLANIDNYALHERLLYKFAHIPSEYQDKLALDLSKKIKHHDLQDRLAAYKEGSEINEKIRKNIERMRAKEASKIE